jgi:nucleoredoxin
MPWLCMPFKASESQILAQKYKASGIPHLVVLDGEGNIITLDGTSEVLGDESGANFPWKQKKFSEILQPAEQFLLSKGEGEGSEDKLLPSSELKDKYLMLYFSASWCPPCRAFTPTLSEFYTKLKAERSDFELLFVSSDKTEADFNDYFKKMSFGALPFKFRDEKAALSKLFGVSGIPMLIIVGPEDEKGNRPLINDSVRSFAESGSVEEFPFYKKNYGDVDGADALNEVKSLVIFCENRDDEEQDEIKNVVKQVAAKLKEESGDGAMNVHWALSHKGLGPRIRQLTKLPAPNMSEDPVLMLLDIPDNGGFYKSDVTDITVESVLKFIEDPGERGQLG